MPALSAVISANSEPLRRELAAVQRMAQQTGRSLETMGGVHAGSSGSMRETLVLMREVSRGNWTRVPGSLSILLGQMGILKMLVKDTSQASEILAVAWEKQSASASVAAVAATRKAQSSLAAFEAETENTEATLAQAVADEEGAAAAISNAKATQAKAVAAREAAAASAGSMSGGVGALGIGVGAAAALAVGIWAGMKQLQRVTSILSGPTAKDFRPEYIAQQLQAVNRIIEDQKQINDEVRKSIDLYESAARAAERVADATKSHFEHLRKMASFEKDPARRAQRELEIDQDERAAELRNKYFEKINLETESAAKQRQAEEIRVSSKEHDQELLNQRKQAMEEAQKFLAENPSVGLGTKAWAEASNAAMRLQTLGASGSERAADLDKALEANRKEAQQKIADYNKTVELVAANEELRKKREELIKQAGNSAAAAALIGKQLPELETRAKQANANEAEEMAGQLANEHGKILHGHVSNLQQVGAYTPVAVSHLNVAQKTLAHVARIDTHLSTGGKGKVGGGVGKVNYGDK